MKLDSPLDAHRTAERAARESYGKLLAILARRSGDLALAEDALSSAFAIALSTWPSRGVPSNAEGWLLTVARREIGHDHRRKTILARLLPAIENMNPHDMEISRGSASLATDARLNLMFTCAHPAIDRAMQAPLMLQTVLGLDAARIASCFLTSPTGMGQRLVRAKAKIRDSKIRFSLPDADDLPDRLDAVLTAIYAAYGTAWDDVDGADGKRKGLAEEAIWLARVVVKLLPSSAEAMGLLSLMLHGQARRAARRDAQGRFVPLSRQDTRRWSDTMIEEAEAILVEAARIGNCGRFQIEAAIQSLHVQRLRNREPQPDARFGPALLALYDLLARLSPTPGVLVARAAAFADNGSPKHALALLSEIEERCGSYQPFWAAKAHALRLAGHMADAGVCYRIAAGLTEDAAVREYLLAAQARLPTIDNP